MLSQAKQNKAHAYLLFLIWPFFALIYALVNYRSSFAKNIVWLFCGFYGFTFVLFDSGDAFRYQEWFFEQYEAQRSISEFWTALSTGVIGRGDYLEPIISYVTTWFTGDHRVLFMIYGLFFGYFFSRNIWYLLNRVKQKPNILVWVFLIHFILILPVWQINGFRFWTASQVFFFAAIRLFHGGKTRYLLLAILAILVHVGYVYAVGLLIAFFLIGVRKYLYLGLVVFGLFLSSLNIETLLSLIPAQIGGTFTNRLDAYTHSEFVEAYFDKSKSAWFKQLLPEVGKYLSFILIFILAFFKRKELVKYKLERLFYFGVFVFGTTTMLNVVPSIQRFFVISSLSITAVWVLYLQEKNRLYWINRFSPVMIICIVFLAVLALRTGASSFGINAFVTNPIIAPYLENSTSVWDIIG